MYEKNVPPEAALEECDFEFTLAMNPIFEKPIHQMKFFFFWWGGGALAAYGGSQARGRFRATAASLWPTPTALCKARSLTRQGRPGVKTHILMDTHRVCNLLSHNGNSLKCFLGYHPNCWHRAATGLEEAAVHGAVTPGAAFRALQLRASQDSWVSAINELQTVQGGPRLSNFRRRTFWCVLSDVSGNWIIPCLMGFLSFLNWEHHLRWDSINQMWLIFHKQAASLWLYLVCWMITNLFSNRLLVCQGWKRLPWWII